MNGGGSMVRRAFGNPLAAWARPEACEQIKKIWKKLMIPDSSWTIMMM